MSADFVNRHRLKARDYDEGDGSTENSFHDQRRALSKGISAICGPQQSYMTGIDHLLDNIDLVLLADHPENVQLWFPSDLPLPMRNKWCVTDLRCLEYRLRYAIAVNALQDIRRFRRFSQVVVMKTQSHISNTQKTRTRIRGQLERIQQRITQAATTYRVCRSAVERLAPNEEFGAWKNILQELRREDIRGPGRGDNETSESRYVPSWIWQTPLPESASSDEQDLSLALRVEWCKAQERAVRYEEEVQLVVEEMRRTLAYFKWLACEWERWAATPAVGGSEADSATMAGVSAYAYKQAAVYRKMVIVFVNDWYECLKTKSLGSPWLQQYPSPPSVKRRRLVSNVRLYHSTSAKLDADTIGPDQDAEDNLSSPISGDMELPQEFTDD